MPGSTISQLARRAGVNVETVRYYERCGLIAEPPRNESSGYREYPEEALRRIRFIRRAQDLGFTLKEIGRLLTATDGTAKACGTAREIREFAIEKLADIDRRIKHLKSLRKALADLTQRCAGSGPLSACPIVASLTGDDDEGGDSIGNKTTRRSVHSRMLPL